MNELLRALAESDRELQAPETVELRLRSAFRKKHTRPRWSYFAIAAAAALVLYLYPSPKPQTMEIAVVTPGVPVLPTSRPPSRKVRHRKSPHEVMTEFYSLIEDAAPFERGELLRVSLPASAMRSVGLPVSEEHLDDPVQADVLVGQEGLARAIRFVRYER
jgi:hypothetical protein